MNRVSTGADIETNLKAEFITGCRGGHADRADTQVRPYSVQKSIPKKSVKIPKIRVLSAWNELRGMSKKARSHETDLGGVEAALQPVMLSVFPPKNKKAGGQLCGFLLGMVVVRHIPDDRQEVAVSGRIG